MMITRMMVRSPLKRFSLYLSLGALFVSLACSRQATEGGSRTKDVINVPATAGEVYVVWLTTSDQLVHYGACVPHPTPPVLPRRECAASKILAEPLPYALYQQRLKEAVLRQRPGGNGEIPGDLDRALILADKIARLRQNC